MLTVWKGVRRTFKKQGLLGGLARIRHAPARIRKAISILVDAYQARRYGHYCVLSPAPLVLYVKYRNKGLELLSTLFASLRGEPAAYFLFHPYWTMEDKAKMEMARQDVAAHAKRFPEHRIVFLANTVGEQALYEAYGLDAFFCSQNSLVDERIFNIIPSVPKVYDAVYDARISPFKRHHLAAEIESLALISYLYDQKAAYSKEVRSLLRHAHWFNSPFEQDYRRLTPEEVSTCLNQCRVGLCLSKVEGAMYASVQYLLCGLPVVSTASIGGREVFFDEEYVLIVEDHPSAVKAGVEEMIRRQVPPGYIRAQTLLKVQVHRDRLINFVQEIYRKHGVDRAFREEWERVFVNKMRLWNRQADVRQKIEAAHQALRQQADAARPVRA